jgi:ketosteroid isomerase-like protein
LVIVLCVAGGVAGGVLGGLALMLYQNGGAHAASVESVPQRQESSGAVTSAPVDAVAANAASSPQAMSPAPVGTTAQPTVVNAREQASAPAEAAHAPAASVAARDSAATVEGDGTGAQADAGTQSELRSALGEWVAATNARDVGRQMGFYAPTVNVFYLSRNASREAVRAEKARVFAAARSVNVEAAPPDIRLSPDGRTAVMRFRKRYQIEGGAGNRNGEVLQELRWHRTGSGWKIVGERDLRVIQ